MSDPTEIERHAEGLELGTPPTLGAPPGLSKAVLSSEDQDSVDLISKDMMQSTDKLLEDKVEKLLTSAAAQLATSFDQQQDQLNNNMEAELKCCRAKVQKLEADKEQMNATVMLLQQQFANLTAQLNSQQCQWPHLDLMSTVGMGGGPVNAGMAGPFATLPSGLPIFPTFQGTASEAATPEKGVMSEPNTTVPPSPLATVPPSPLATPNPSAPPTPSHGHLGMASIPFPFPAPPPGLSERPVASPMFSPMLAPMGPPPGLSELSLDAVTKPPARISLSAAIDASPNENAKPVLAEKAKLTPVAEELHSKAVQLMQSTKDTPDSCDSRFRSPKASPGPRVGFASPGPRLGTPSRLMASPLGGGPNTTPKRTPRLSFSKLPPAITASPFVICESGGSVFGFTIRKADDCSLGLDVNHTDAGNYLEVTGVQPGSAMHAWNKQCAGGPAAGKAIVPGDRVVKVNNATTPQEMLQECRDQKLLKFTVQRGEVDDDFDTLGLYGK